MNISETRNGKGKASRGVEKAVCDINLDKSPLWRTKGPSQADSKETIHTLMEDGEFISSCRVTGREGARPNHVRHVPTSERERA